MNILSDHVARNMPSGLLTVDRTGLVVSCNPASERIFGKNLKPNSNLCGLVRESAALWDRLERCFRTGETFTRVEFNVPVTPDMDKRIGINLSPINDSTGDIVGAICLLSDLTEIVELQNQIKLKENFAALGEMSAGIAHEFKNSIATIVGYAQMCTTETDLQTIHGYVREIQKESQALSVIVTDFLNFARPVNASFHRVDLVELLAGVIADVQSLRPGNYMIRFKTTTEARVPCDATLMRQTFLNLLINAIESLPGGSGTISVLVERGFGAQIRIIVDDTGMGIPSDQISKIFFPFFTTKSNGTGLGLSLAQKIILAHNGRIEAQSTEGKGTRFAITLPEFERDSDSEKRSS